MVKKTIDWTANRLKNAVVILSGGLDSTTLLYDIFKTGFNVKALSFDYGQKHKRELGLAKQTCDKLGIEHKILDLSVLNEIAPSALTRKDWKMPEGHYAQNNMSETVVPNRNMVLLSLATSYAIANNCSRLFYGAHGGDHHIYADCRPNFVWAMRQAIKLCDEKDVSLDAPYIDMNKITILKKGLKLGVDYSLTNTCYNPQQDLACGNCGACNERVEAFIKNNVIDPIQYVKPWKEIIKNTKQVLEDKKE